MRALRVALPLVVVAVALGACSTFPSSAPPVPTLADATTLDELALTAEQQGVVQTVVLDVQQQDGAMLRVSLHDPDAVEADAVVALADALVPLAQELVGDQSIERTSVQISLAQDAAQPVTVMVDDAVGLEHVAPMLETATTTPCTSLRVLDDAAVGPVLAVDCAIELDAATIAERYDAIAAIGIDSTLVQSTQWRIVPLDGGDDWELELRDAPIDGRGDLLAEAFAIADAHGATLRILDDGDSIRVMGETEDAAACDALFELLDADPSFAYPPSVMLDGVTDGDGCQRLL